MVVLQGMPGRLSVGACRRLRPPARCRSGPICAAGWGVLRAKAMVTAPSGVVLPVGGASGATAPVAREVFG